MTANKTTAQRRGVGEVRLSSERKLINGCPQRARSSAGAWKTHVMHFHRRRGDSRGREVEVAVGEQWGECGGTASVRDNCNESGMRHGRVRQRVKRFVFITAAANHIQHQRRNRDSKTKRAESHDASWLPFKPTLRCNHDAREEGNLRAIYAVACPPSPALGCRTRRRIDHVTQLGRKAT